MEGTRNDNSPVSLEAGRDHDHLPVAEAEVILRKGPSRTEYKSHMLSTGSLCSLPIPDWIKAKLPSCECLDSLAV